MFARQAVLFFIGAFLLLAFFGRTGALPAPSKEVSVAEFDRGVQELDAQTGALEKLVDEINYTAGAAAARTTQLYRRNDPLTDADTTGINTDASGSVTETKGASGSVPKTIFDNTKKIFGKIVDGAGWVAKKMRLDVVLFHLKKVLYKIANLFGKQIPKEYQGDFDNYTKGQQ